MDKNAIAHAYEIDALFAVVSAVINLLHAKRVEKNFDGRVERDTMLMKVQGRFVGVPLEFESHITTDFPYSRALMSE